MEDAFEHVGRELLLGLLGRLLGGIDMCTLIFGARDEALGGHDLQELESARVADVFLTGEHLVDLPNRGRSARPEDLEDREFRGSGVAFGVLLHGAEATTKNFVLSTKVFVDRSGTAHLTPAQ